MSSDQNMDIHSDDIHRYDDMINLLHPASTNHPHMPIQDRAAQFAPFAALTGHDAAIRETARLTNRKVELDPERKAVLDEKLQMLREEIEKHPGISVTYFQPDEKKSGGAYVTITGIVKKIDVHEQALVTTDGLKISIDGIMELDSELFHSVL